MFSSLSKLPRLSGRSPVRRFLERSLWGGGREEERKGNNDEIWILKRRGIRRREEKREEKEKEKEEDKNKNKIHKNKIKIKIIHISHVFKNIENVRKNTIEAIILQITVLVCFLVGK